MNYPFENDTSAVIKNQHEKVCVLIRRKTYLPFGNYCSRCYDNDVVAHSAKYHYQNQKEIEGLHQGIFFDITQDSKEKFLANEEVKVQDFPVISKQ